jgi:hypothetical protein
MGKGERLKMPFGKYYGTAVADLPYGYAMWLWNNVDLPRWGIKCAVRDRLGLSDEEEGEDKDDALLQELGEIQERLEQALHTGRQPQRALLEAADENERLKQCMKTVYRKLSFRCHPDRGGDHEAMVLLNELLGA